VGRVDAEHAYCVSEKLPGITFQDADEAEVIRLLEPVTEVWRAICDTDISDTSGYGDFDGDGIGKYRTWHDYLLSILDCDWQKVTDRIDSSLLDRLTREFESLLPSCPEERRLVYGDFGSNNLLVHKGRVTGVLDWDNAIYGDPLLDIAGAYFWRTWLICTEKSAEYWDEHLAATPNYRERIRCYQLRAALHELYDNTMDGDAETLDWLQHRSEQILVERS
jgi:hygromycin-B 4-O-kinase